MTGEDAGRCLAEACESDVLYWGRCVEHYGSYVTERVEAAVGMTIEDYVWGATKFASTEDEARTDGMNKQEAEKIARRFSGEYRDFAGSDVENIGEDRYRVVFYSYSGFYAEKINEIRKAVPGHQSAWVGHDRYNGDPVTRLSIQ